VLVFVLVLVLPLLPQPVASRLSAVACKTAAMRREFLTQKAETLKFYRWQARSRSARPVEAFHATSSLAYILQ
jgi:hypothetical protein